MNALDQPAPTASPSRTQPASLDLPPDHPANHVRTIRASRGWVGIDWNELYQARELFGTLIMRDIRLRYKQTTLGVAWAVLQPLLSMGLFTMLFGNFKQLQPVAVPYSLFIFAGQVPWTFFTNAVTNSGTSLLSQQHLLTKIYFPRLFVPAANVGAYLIDLLIGLALFGLLLFLVPHAPPLTWRLFFLPLIVLLTFAAAFGLGLILASATVLFRDLRFLIPFVMQLLMFASPIFYPVSSLTERVRPLIALNPMTGVISAYRWAILGMDLDPIGLSISIVATVASLVFGLFFFRRTERFLADLL